MLIIIIFIIRFESNTDQKTARTSEFQPKGFTFLTLHADTVLTDKVKDELSGPLGSVAVETKTPLDLEMHYSGFLEKHFPRLDVLNRRLNYEKGLKIRIEHNTTKLIYRYSPAFNYVELFFSNYNRKPLLFHIKAKKDAKDIVETIKNKYGAPKEIRWGNQNEKSLFWKQNNNVLIISLLSDRYGNPQYEIMIGYLQNIEALLKTELKENQQLKKNQSLPSQKVF